jgi:hypothetical protein
MKPWLVATALCALIVAPVTTPAEEGPDIEVDGRHFDATITVEHGGTAHELHATGSHKRKKFFFSIYAAVAYVGGQDFWTLVERGGERSDWGELLLEAEGPHRMHLKMLRGLDATRITDGINEAIEKTATRPLDEIAEERERFVGLFEGELDEDQSLLMTWFHGEGLEIRIDDDVIDTIPGDDFARTFFEIYFGPKPVDDGMKEDLLRRVRGDD